MTYIGAREIKGAKVVHTIRNADTGTIVATRTSAHSYNYASVIDGRVTFHRNCPNRPNARRSIVTLVNQGPKSCVICANEPVPGMISEQCADGSRRTGPCYGQAHG